ncbi:MOSC domain-containing protein [Nocardioides sp.]|uniref:MOSC domain-containing protein n=1 Tax=Nocardioides sp. TaxID=35761 RepID=UPI001A304689|nr:MOSC domain-containing protein [Nocardioides sp.]MBJ7359543.1 MOSC domain-containing protein [Nocardioides sp.]
MTARIQSVNVGSAEPNPARRGGGVTGFGKRPVGSALLRAPGPGGSGLEGDVIGNPRFHGGDLQAVYAYAREELDTWEERLGLDLPDGAFAENLTLRGLDVDASRVGDLWAIGAEVVLEVTAPRTPCRTFANRMGVKGWMRQFTEAGRPGAYLRVVSPGVVRVDDPVVVTPATDGAPLHDVFREMMGQTAPPTPSPHT